MCGILLSVAPPGAAAVDTEASKTFSDLSEGVARRGPSGTSTHQTCTGDHADSLLLTLFGAVLHLRGQCTLQPVVDDAGNALVWNGEVFGGIDVGDEENDTQVVFSALRDAQDAQGVLVVLSRVRGPWAFAYWQARERKLWFGRDFFGRRSLVWQRPADGDGCFLLSSVVSLSAADASAAGAWEEVPTVGVYALNFARHKSVLDASREMEVYPWHHGGGNCAETQSLVCPITAPFNTALPSEGDLPDMASTDDVLSELERCHAYVDAVTELIDRFSEAVRHRVYPVPPEAPRIAILFSGGIDSMMMAALAARHVPESEPIDLVNVAFGNANAARSARELGAQQAQADEQQSEVVRDACSAGGAHNHSGGECPPPHKGNKKKKSGKRKGSAAGESDDGAHLYNVPDRITGRAGARELGRLFPERTWNFVEVDIPLAELEEHKTHVQSLCYPLDTVMDLSIATAMWFAARGKGRLCTYGGGDEPVVRSESAADSSHPSWDQTYLTPARVMLVGIGADEQLGGYGRHRTKYKVDGWAGLVGEMKFDVGRISHRNLGRDDRVISDHGREARFPFLDEALVSYLNALPVWLKADMRYPRGTGEKLLLRLAARRIGLGDSALLAKRAIQFGSRVAKIENTKEKGTDKLTATADE